MKNQIVFSTLACPEWDIETVIARAAEYGYDGIEWRGGPDGHIQPGLSQEHRQWIRRKSYEAGIFVHAVTAYPSFISLDPEKQKANLDNLEQYLDLASDLGAKFLRIFIGELEQKNNYSLVYPAILYQLEKALSYAETCGVILALEPHDDFVRLETLLPILEQVKHSHLKVIWDVGNNFAAGDGMEQYLPLLPGRIAYLHLKDGRGRGENWQLYPLGKGDVPFRKIFEALHQTGFQGALSVEWERAWHPGLDRAEIALPNSIRFIQGLKSTMDTATSKKDEAIRGLR